MALEVYLNFKGNAREAIAYYEEVFDTKCTGLMTYGELHSPDGPPMDESVKDLVLNANVKIEGSNVMFSDLTPEMSLVVGDNISLVIDTVDEEKITRQFNRLAEKGQVKMPLEKTFWSEKYGHVVDQFGVGWQFNLLEA